jgi:outer membrane protein
MKARRRSPLVGATACGLALAFAAGTTRAQDRDQSYQPHAGTIAFKLGGAGVFFNSSGKLRLAGQPLAGADLKASDNATAIFEAEYYFRPDLSLSLTVGVPPTLTATGKGTLAPLGELGSVEYGPGAVLAKYHFDEFGRFQPYLAAGATRMLVFAEHDAAITSLNVHPSWGGAIQAGADYMLTPHWGAFASVTHLFLRTHGEGEFSGLPAQAKIALDPTIAMGGLTFRY